MTHADLPLAASEQQRRDDSRIGALLVADGALTQDDAERVAAAQAELGLRFGEAAQHLGLAGDADLQRVLARQFDYPYLRPGQGRLSSLLAAAYEPFGAQAEMLRAVRSQLMLRWFGRGHRSLAVAGVDTGDGASVFAANLALAFAQLGEPVLLADANLRAPAQHLLFDTGGRRGLSDILAGRADLDLVEEVDSFPLLSLLAAGTLPPNPQELLSRPAFAALGATLESRYAVVLYDVAASTAGLDALVVAARAGGALIVARKDHTRHGDIRALAGQLAHHGARVVGAVMADLP